MARVAAPVFIVGMVILAFVVLLLPGLQSRPALPQLPALPVQQAAEVVAAVVAPAAPAFIRTNWGDVELDVMDALDHALSRHGAIAAQILAAARDGRCVVYLECGQTWQTLRDGTRGYFACNLDGGQVGVVPFYADYMLLRLVAMTAYPVRSGYERYVTRRDGCAPVEFLAALIGGEYAEQQ